MSMQEANKNPFDHRREYGELLSVRDLAQMLRTKKPAEVDAWIQENANDIPSLQHLCGVILKYLVARGL